MDYKKDYFSCRIESILGRVDVEVERLVEEIIYCRDLGEREGWFILRCCGEIVK